MRDIAIRLRKYGTSLCTARQDLDTESDVRLMLDAAHRICELEGLLTSSILRERIAALECKRLRAKLTEYEKDAIEDDLIRGEG
jgi:hypothetical protein